MTARANEPARSDPSLGTSASTRSTRLRSLIVGLRRAMRPVYSRDAVHRDAHASVRRARCRRRAPALPRGSAAGSMRTRSSTGAPAARNSPTLVRRCSTTPANDAYTPVLADLLPGQGRLRPPLGRGGAAALDLFERVLVAALRHLEAGLRRVQLRLGDEPFLAAGSPRADGRAAPRPAPRAPDGRCPSPPDRRGRSTPREAGRCGRAPGPARPPPAGPGARSRWARCAPGAGPCARGCRGRR